MNLYLQPQLINSGNHQTRNLDALLTDHRSCIVLKSKSENNEALNVFDGLISMENQAKRRDSSVEEYF
jgi:hypothetical protein